jgi:hypothetical protein
MTAKIRKVFRMGECSPRIRRHQRRVVRPIGPQVGRASHGLRTVLRPGPRSGAPIRFTHATCRDAARVVRAPLMRAVLKGRRVSVALCCDLSVRR